jgi:hypothetical protein
VSRTRLSKEYRYHHGYWDGAEREFRGFGRVDVLDTETRELFNAGAAGPDAPFDPVPESVFAPSTETRTWFHQGPVGDEFLDRAETDFSGEFASGEPQVFSRPPPLAEFLAGLSGGARQDALRAFRGSPLRSELFVRDGSALEGRPFSVSEWLYGLREEDPPAAGEEGRRRVFFPHLLAERVSRSERGVDPLHTFRFQIPQPREGGGEDAYDRYGQPRSEVMIAVPRGRAFASPAPAGDPYLCVLTETAYAQRDDAAKYVVDRVAGTTTLEIPNDGTLPLFDLVKRIEDGSQDRRIIGQVLRFYDGPPFLGLPFGILGDFGAPARTETLVLTEEVLHEAYKSGPAVLTPAEEPPYLAPGDPPPWTDDYPQEFRDLLPARAGYTPHAGGDEFAAGFFAATERRRYDFHDSPTGRGRGLVTATRDPLGRDTVIGYDRFGLLPETVTDPAGLRTQARHNYRVFQPEEVTDPNDNHTLLTYSPLGLLAGVALLGKGPADEGDSPDKPGKRFEFDFTPFSAGGRPISVRTFRRVHHANENGVAEAERDDTLVTVEYSDGFGRLVQTRALAEDVNFGDPVFGDGPLPADQAATPGAAVGRRRPPDAPDVVVVSGWQSYDNKGHVIEKFEPFLSGGFDYLARPDAPAGLFGRRVQFFYDPHGRVVRTVNPDGSEQRVVHGVPGGIAGPDLSNPDVFEPTPWEIYTYDANDNAGPEPTPQSPCPSATTGTRRPACSWTR